MGEATSDHFPCQRRRDLHQAGTGILAREFDPAGESHTVAWTVPALHRLPPIKPFPSVWLPAHIHL